MRTLTAALLATASPRAFNVAAPSMATTPAAVAAAKVGHQNTDNDGDALLKRAPDMLAMIDYWDLIDAIMDGVEGMKREAERFMPRFTDEGSDDYGYRLKCSKMTNVFRDGVEGLASKPFEKEVTLVKDKSKTVPEAVETFVEDVDGSGNNLTVFGSQTFFSGIASGINWIFVDAPPVDPTIRSVKDAKERGGRPYWSHVLGRNMLEARSKVIGGREVLMYARMLEPGKPDRIRIFERADNGVVTWQLWERTADWRDYTGPGGGRTRFAPVDGAEGAGVVTIGRIPLVPFITGRRDGRTFRFSPLLRDAADLQVNLYQNESALEWNKRLGAYAMLSGNGVKPEMEADGRTPKKLFVGPNRILYAPPNGQGDHGNWEYVQPGAEIMRFLKEDIEATRKELRELARQPLTATMGVTVIQAGMAAGKAKSAVGAWALGLKDALENAMVLTCLFLGIRDGQYDPTVSVYTDFDQFTEGKDLDALRAMRDGGDLSQETYWSENKRRGVLSDEFDPETERVRLLKEVPADPDIGEPDEPPVDDPNKPKDDA